MSDRTEISEIGEFGLIEAITKDFPHVQTSTIKGVGDDAAVIDMGENKLLVSTDMLVEGIHFDLSYMPLKHLGYKAVVVNISDIAAMNGTPTQITVSIGLSNRFSKEAVEELYSGIRHACENYKVDLVGGDTTSTPGGLCISVTAIGHAKANDISYRGGAKIEDVICVTGDLGGAFMGLHILEREKQAFKADPNLRPDLEDKDYVVGKQLRPEARMDFIYVLRDLGIVPNAMIDVSDGLASELFHLHSQSSLGMKIYEDKLPIDEMTRQTSVEFNIDPTTSILNGGEDYELLFTLPVSEFEKINTHPDVTAIGYVTAQENGVQMVFRSGNVRPLEAQGWQHFKKASPQDKE